MGLFTEQKALSPLVATILLIAFAVSLGVLIMTWTISPSHEEGEPCEDVSLALQPLTQGEAICYDVQTSHLSFVVKNTGSKTIPILELRAVDKQQNLEIQQIPVDILAGGAGKFTLEYQTQFPTDTTATVLPVVIYQGERVICAEQEIEAHSVPLC